MGGVVNTDKWPENVILERGDGWCREATVLWNCGRFVFVTPLSEITFERTADIRFNLPVFRQTSERMVNHR